jgi:hypothetical protein
MNIIGHLCTTSRITLFSAGFGAISNLSLIPASEAGQIEEKLSKAVREYSTQGTNSYFAVRQNVCVVRDHRSEALAVPVVTTMSNTVSFRVLRQI